jgi:hypothetical protein
MALCVVSIVNSGLCLVHILYKGASRRLEEINISTCDCTRSPWSVCVYDPETADPTNTCSATHVHEEGPATSWNTSTSQSLNGRVESVRYVIQIKLVSLEKNLVDAACKSWSIFVAHEPAFLWR